LDITDHYYLIQAIPKKKIESLIGYTLITILSNADAAPLLLPFMTIGIIDKYFSHNISYSFVDMFDHGVSSAPGNHIHCIAAYTSNNLDKEEEQRSRWERKK
jgi:hypothetical protein